MTTKRPQNSILVLATLGVYLGLVLAGATPQILAQAATTRLFDVKDEIEVKDDLDNKPDSHSEAIFVDEVASLIDKLNGYVREDKFSWKSKFDFGIEDFSLSKDGYPSFLGYGSLDRPEVQYFEESAVACGRNLLREKIKANAGEKFSKWPETLDFKFHSDGNIVRYDISVSTSDKAGALRLHAALVRYLETQSRTMKSSTVRLVAKQTTSEVNDVKVILVTRLARSDLDALLAKDAK